MSSEQETTMTDASSTPTPPDREGSEYDDDDALIARLVDDRVRRTGRIVFDADPPPALGEVEAVMRLVDDYATAYRDIIDDGRPIPEEVYRAYAQLCDGVAALARPAALVPPADLHAVLNLLMLLVDMPDRSDTVMVLAQHKREARRLVPVLARALDRPAELAVPGDVLEIQRNWTNAPWKVRVRWSRDTGSVVGKGETAQLALIDGRRLAALYDDAPDPSAVGPMRSAS